MLGLRELGLKIAVSSSRFTEPNSAEEALLLGNEANGKKLSMAEREEKKG